MNRLILEGWAGGPSKMDVVRQSFILGKRDRKGLDCRSQLAEEQTYRSHGSVHVDGSMR